MSDDSDEIDHDVRPSRAGEIDDLPGSARQDKIDQRAGRNLAEARELRGMSQTELAERMTERGHKFHQQTVQKIEKGQRQLRFSEAICACYILEIGVESLDWEPFHFDEALALERNISQLGASRELLVENAKKMLFLTEILEKKVTEIENENRDIGTGLARPAIALGDPVAAAELAVQEYRKEKELEGVQLKFAVTAEADGNPYTFFGRGNRGETDSDEDGQS